MPIRPAVLTFIALLIGSSAPVLAQQPISSLVVLASQDRALIGSKPIAPKDIVSRLLSQQPAQRGLHMVTIQSCPGVSADAVQGLVADLQKNRMMPVVDLNPPEPRLCAR
ncbi:MAG TPA: hypothetical protein VJ740_03820 [Hyphomicrobiaceae bacterium]|nr:hypothetical protein [Hyphomicrobiaceae bacterium]